ncbi:hypothetical protein BKN49_06050 [Pseudomonas aeruginosa]|nr:hypothetical protein BKN49_06050 [Pseudomonas aeruginosa]
MDPQMTRFAATLSFIAGVTLAGCSTPPANQGNPFDEPSHPLAPSPARQVVLETAAAHNTPSVPPRAYAMATPETYSAAIAFPVNESPQQLSAEEASNSSHLALEEARRVGAQGDTGTMIELMEQSAYMGNDDALYELARIFHNGVGVPKDITRAIGYLTTADGRGHLEATRVLAWDYLLGNGVQADRQYAEQLFEKASTGSQRAKREYGMLLADLAPPGLHNLDKGIALLTEASAMGDSEATFLLSQALDKKGDIAGAANARELAGARGFLQPVDKPKLTVQGVKAEVQAESLKTQALSGDRQAMYDLALGLLLRKYPSIDGEFDAYCWLSVAKDLGHPGSAQELKSIQGVRAEADAVTPGRMDQCISDLHQAIAR